MSVPVQLGVVQFIEHSAVNDFLLPADGDCTCAELLEESLIRGIDLDILDLRVVPQLISIFGIDHIGFWHPGGLLQPCLQTVEVDILEKIMVSWVVTFAG